MARISTLTYDRGTLILHPPPRGKDWLDFAAWDDRVERFRIPGIHYRALVEALQQQDVEFKDEAKGFEPLKMAASLERQPYAHQQEALAAWVQAKRQGVVVLPTASGKTYLAQMAMQVTPRSTLITVPTLDLMHQWYTHLLAAFPDEEVGLLGGGSKDRTPILVATYDSAAIHAEALGNRYGLLICDECHHLPSDFNRAIAESSIAPYRLGLTATPDRTDGRHQDLNELLGPVVYQRTAEELAGHALAPYDIVPIRVKLSPEERDRYETLIATRNEFLEKSNIWLGSLEGWQRFVQASARSQAGRRAMLAHREARAIALGTEGKLRILADLLAQHYPDRTLIFTNDNATVYRISQSFLIPAITHQTPVKERHDILQKFRDGTYHTLVVSHVLNEGVDVPDARVAVLLSGSGSTREYIQRLGRILRKGTGEKQAILYEVVAEETTEEGVSRRRRTGSKPPRKENQLELVPPSPYEKYLKPTRRTAAEPPGQYPSTSQDDPPF
ncbi:MULTISPECIES: DEAD/DEAH box helicase family protein [unclassified Leptolyngbya]|uniref:DEAD/DEAH box helicase n=1 Tax=unclassified Leptolyngbya TaxID=2650499 RepID=UPI0016876A02|nr:MULTISPECIES: DEAD/DEAH box helicase family protein [unclassified Leptolyngbya]MBD1912768.1 DEAD/DEAH box helicase [Leptolyngbya sp. FACHB-8]MBD2157715.1 DEAD/DEAH box helicase [Leptolyngbya sp. FACHB-16]